MPHAALGKSNRPQPPRTPRKTLRTVLLAFAGLSLLVIVFALWFAQTRYEAVFRAPRVPHESYATGNTALKVVVKPALAPRQIASLVMPERKLPDWLLGMSMPEETAVMLDPDLNSSTVELRMFVNYARLGPVILAALNQSGIAAGTQGIQWSPPEAVLKQRGVLLLEGSVPLASQIVKGTQEQWFGAVDYPPPSINGNHVLEAALENRNGKGYAALAALAEINGPSDASIQAVLNPKSLYLVSTLHAYADFVDDDTLAIVLELEGNATASPNVGKQLKSFLDLALGVYASQLRKEYGVELKGSSTVEASTVTGKYTLKGIHALLTQLQAAR